MNPSDSAGPLDARLTGIVSSVPRPLPFRLSHLDGSFSWLRKAARGAVQLRPGSGSNACRYREGGLPPAESADGSDPRQQSLRPRLAESDGHDIQLCCWFGGAAMAFALARARSVASLWLLLPVCSRRFSALRRAVRSLTVKGRVYEDDPRETPSSRAAAPRRRPVRAHRFGSGSPLPSEARRSCRPRCDRWRRLCRSPARP